MEGLLFFRVYPSDGFRFILIPDGNPSHEFPVLDGNPSSNMNSAIDCALRMRENTRPSDLASNFHLEVAFQLYSFKCVKLLQTLVSQSVYSLYKI